MRDSFEIMLVLLAIIAFNTCDGCGCSCGNSEEKKRIEAVEQKLDKIDKRLDKVKCP